MFFNTAAATTFVLLCGSFVSSAPLNATVSTNNGPISNWLGGSIATNGVAYKGLFNNISPQGVYPGIILASPSKQSPNYYYHWIRDSALTMDVVNTLYMRGSVELEEDLWRYAALSRRLQTLPTLTGLGEPKFTTDAGLFNDGWCRPQTDGPALTASTLIRFAKEYLKRGGSIERVKKDLYDSQLETKTVIKAGLEYVAANWQMETCDLWEEVRSRSHFYTRMVQRRALLEGAEFAASLGDKGASDYYRRVANEITLALDTHFDSGKGFIVETPTDRSRAGLNAGTVLAVLHTDTTSGGKLDSFSPIDDRVLVTIPAFIESFRNIYSINKVKTTPQGEPLGIALGRYAEDIYDGIATSQGNPWFLTTTAVAEIYYRMIVHWRQRGSIDVNNLNKKFFDYIGVNNLVAGKSYSTSTPEFEAVVAALSSNAEALVRRVRFHSDNGRLPEEYNRNTGYVQGAVDLTWSYAAIFTAEWARQAAGV